MFHLCRHHHETSATRPQPQHAVFAVPDNEEIMTAEQAPQSERCLQGCICLVTGASRGIGKGIALELGLQGATVYVTGTSSSSTSNNNNNHPGTIEETSQQITDAGGRGIAVYCDHADDNQVQALMQRIATEQDGRLDILINNAFRMPTAGVQNLGKKFWQQDDALEAWDSVHQVGLRNHYVASYYAMPLLLKAAAATHSRQKTTQTHPNNLPRPFIGMVSSFGGLTYTFNVPYGVGKVGVDRMVKDMAIELESEDICIVSFWPGMVKTELTNMLIQNGDWEKHVKVPLVYTESPQFTGRAVVAVATDRDNMRKSGTYQVVAELAQEYGFTDVDGIVPPSIRSLRFLLPSYGMDEATREKVPSWLIPDWKLPFWMMAQGKPPA